LILGPFLALGGVGWYYLWSQHLAFYAWWPFAGCLALGYVLAWYWQHKRQLLRPPDFEVPHHWTERDAQAWKLVEARAHAAGSLDPAKLSDMQHYLTVAQDLARELAVYYHPQAQDPIGNLTIPEILAVVELSAHDLTEMVDRYLPGGHLLSLK